MVIPFLLPAIFCPGWRGASFCNSSATLPLATGTFRGSKCGRSNKIVGLSTLTLILGCSGWYERGRRIAGTVRMFFNCSSRQRGRLPGGEVCARKCRLVHKVDMGMEVCARKGCFMHKVAGRRSRGGSAEAA